MGIIINNREYAWTDVEIFMFGQKVSGITAIDYKSKVAKSHLFASGRGPRSIQKGRREYDGTLTLLQSEVIALNNSAVAAGHKDILDVEPDIIVKYVTEEGVIIMDKICCASFTELPNSMKEGDANMTVALPFLALNIDFNI